MSFIVVTIAMQVLKVPTIYFLSTQAAMAIYMILQTNKIRYSVFLLSLFPIVGAAVSFGAARNAKGMQVAFMLFSLLPFNLLACWSYLYVYKRLQTTSYLRRYLLPVMARVIFNSLGICVALWRSSDSTPEEIQNTVFITAYNSVYDIAGIVLAELLWVARNRFIPKNAPSPQSHIHKPKKH
jgi:hypothetical protein